MGRAKERILGCLVVLAATLASLSAAGAASASNSFGSDMFGISAGGAIQGEDATTLARDLDAIDAVGSQWIRIDINWEQIQAGGPTSYNWTAIDRLVAGATARGLKVLGVIEYTPSWARPPGTSGTWGPDPLTYANFARKAAEHYSAMGVHAYEIWNEPNISAFWTPSPNPIAYAQLLRAAYPAIKSADPQATVLTGGTAPAATDGTNYWPSDWLTQIYAYGAGGYFDAVSHHPYCFPATPGDPENWSAWYLMDADQGRFSYGDSPWGGPFPVLGGDATWGGPSMRSVMTANGDGAKKIWGTEFGAPTNGPNGVSEHEQAEMIAEGYELWKTYDWAGPLFTHQGRDLGTDTSTRENFFGLLRHNFSQKPAYGAYRAAAEGAGAGATGHAPGSSADQENLSRLDEDHQRRPWTTATTTTAPQISKRSRRSRADGVRKTTLRATVTGAAGGIGLIEVQVRRDREWATYRIARDEVGSSGRFAVTLALNPGKRYRARAGYLGSKVAAASASPYKRFTL